MKQLKDKKIQKLNREVKQLKTMNRFYSLWIAMSIEGKSIGEYFRARQAYKIAVYGYGVVGKLVCDGLDKEQLYISNVIDRQSVDTPWGKTVNVVSEPVDIVIVTVLNEFQDIREKLEQQIDCPIISIMDVICDTL